MLITYKITQDYPLTETYGLISQMRRASVSVPANIAEGFKRLGKKDKIKFYNISQASLEELSYYYFLSKDLNYVKVVIEVDNMLMEIGKMLNGLIQSIR